MQIKPILILLFVLLCTISVEAQRKVWYTTNGADGAIFSLANDVQMDGRDVTPILRFSPVFNFGTNLHFNPTDHAGMFIGWNVRNIGLITRDSLGKDDRFKRRVYTLGVPLALKFGNLARDRFFFLGGEISFPFHYKEKFFPDGDRDRKEKRREWFSERVEPFQYSAFAGIHFSKRLSIKVQYFFNNFFNQDYTTTDAQGNQIRPYQNYNANLFFVTFGYDLSDKKVWDRRYEDQPRQPKKSL